MHIEYVDKDYTYKCSIEIQGSIEFLGIARYSSNDSDYAGWYGPYAGAPISREMRAYLDRALKLKAFW